VNWSITGFVLIFISAVALVVPTRFSVSLIPAPLVVTFWSGAVFLFYVSVRKDPFVIILSDAVSLISTFVFFVMVFSYVVVFLGARLPLIDGELAAADRYLGMDWPASLKWMNEHFLLAGLLQHAYRSLFWQAIAVILILSVSGRHRRLQVFLLAFQFTALAASAISGILPAFGAYEFYQIVPAEHPAFTPAVTTAHVAELLNLRGAAPLVRLDDLNGIVTFPSFHAVLGVLFAWAFWPLRYLRWPALVMNVAMIAATPISGAHHFVDVLAGLAVAWAGLWLSLKVARGIEEREAGSINAIQTLAPITSRG
jgi:membrane-associated phospholipid phosphatase